MREFAAFTEVQFAESIETCAEHELLELLELLVEEHPLYAERGTAEISRMRGWILLALARGSLSDRAIAFVIEELETGIDPYLIAAAASALRSSQQPSTEFAPHLLRAILRMRMRDEPVHLTSYGNETGIATSPMAELFATLEWLGPHARGSLPEMEAMRQPSIGLPRKMRGELERLERVIRGADSDECCEVPAILRPWFKRREAGDADIHAATFEDHDGNELPFREFFTGRPTIVVFFYTRCDNPQKCSLTLTKLARVQQILSERGFGERIRTAAITYDPEYDLAARMRNYGINRGLQFGPDRRMFRTTSGFPAVQRHFRLGVNFIRSLVNRHRLEVFVLAADGRVVGSYQRLHWSEAAVVDRAVDALTEKPARWSKVSPVLGLVSSLAVAFLPKCPICWAAYLSMFGVVGLEKIPYLPWLVPILVIAMLVNLASVGLRSRSTGRWWPTALVAVGAGCLVASRLGWEGIAILGVVLTVLGSIGSTLRRPGAGHTL